MVWWYCEPLKRPRAQPRQSPRAQLSQNPRVQPRHFPCRSHTVMEYESKTSITKAFLQTLSPVNRTSRCLPSKELSVSKTNGLRLSTQQNKKKMGRDFVAHSKRSFFGGLESKQIHFNTYYYSIPNNKPRTGLIKSSESSKKHRNIESKHRAFRWSSSGVPTQSLEGSIGGRCF